MIYDATLFIAGIAVFAVTAALFVYCLPRAGKVQRFVGTEIEPYVAIVFVAGITLSVTMILSAIIDLVG